MPGTTFSTANWTGYDEATVTNPSAQLDNFSLVVDIPVASLSTDWKNEVQSDGGDIRVTKGDDTELPFDLIDWSHTPGTPPTITGIIRLKWSGALSASGTQKVRIYAGYTGGGNAVAYDANDVSGFGSDDAYDANWLAYWPLHDLNDRTSNSYDLTEVGTMAGHTTGKLGDGYQTDGTDTEGLQNTSVPITGGSNLTILGWSSALNSTAEALIGSNASYEMVLRNDSGKPQFVLNSFSSNDRATGATTLTATWTHFGGRYDGTALDVFLNGVSDGSVTPTGSYASFTGVCIGTFGLGTIPSGGASSIHDDVQIHTAGRSDEWISHEYDQTSANATFWGTWSWTAVGGGGFGGVSNVIGGGIAA